MDCMHWYMNIGTRHAEQEHGLSFQIALILPPRLLFDRSSEDSYSSPGSPMMCRTPAGTLVIAKIKTSYEGTCILMKGQGATPKGGVPFLDLLNMYDDLFHPFMVHLLSPLLRLSESVSITWGITWFFTELRERKSGYGKVAKRSTMNLFLH